MIRRTADKGKGEIKHLGRRPTAVVVYDNLEQMQGVRHQRLEQNSKMISVTTGLVIEGIHIPEKGLKAKMLDYDKQLRHLDVVMAPGLNETAPEMREVSFHSLYEDIQRN